MKRLIICFLFFSGTLYASQPLAAQTNYFVDGYHGGIYGHYPLWVTKFITDNLHNHKDWKVNLEIEPESWDSIQLKDPAGYAAIKKYLNDSSDSVPVEYVNPAYAQGYLYNISEESIIRQFQYGIAKLKQHFPSIQFTTYSSEEPCFTSALPQVLRSLGFKYASLKNPNTCWGGYVRAYGGELLNWVGPDGSSIPTVPRYASERLQQNSTWQTIAWNNSRAYVNAAISQGIQNPVGMCLQDAGWKNGPWLKDIAASSTQYTTWRNYFKLIGSNKTTEEWRLTQEDINVSLVWGAQVLQRLAQQVRIAENNITMAEKTAALAKLYAGMPYPEKEFDEAWRTLLLSQHHDCWIVPYNRHNGKTWADNVKDWTDHTNTTSAIVTEQSLKALPTTRSKQQNILAINTTAFNRSEVLSIALPKNHSVPTGVEYKGKTVASQIVINKDSSMRLLFMGNIPPLGYTSFSLVNTKKQAVRNGASVKRNTEGDYVMETDLYKLVIGAQNGNIRQLVAKKLDNKNFISNNTSDFNALRGHFYNDGGHATSSGNKPTITILENGPLQIQVQIENTIGGNTYAQRICLKQGAPVIDCNLHIDYKQNTGIGEDYKQAGGYRATDNQKAFYNDTCKLLAVFPLNLENQKVYKDAPLDVTESRLTNTFYNSWDSIKNNIIFNWVDVTDGNNNYGMALFSDHVTSYSHGENFPLALTLQYAGMGLWGMNYAVTGPSDIHYALLPHKGKWDEAGINTEVIRWNQPVITTITNAGNTFNSFMDGSNEGIAVTAMYYKGNDLYVRLVNNSSSESTHAINFNCYADDLQFVELNDSVTSTLTFQKGQKVNFNCTIPRFGFKTIKLANAKP